MGLGLILFLTRPCN